MGVDEAPMGLVGIIVYAVFTSGVCIMGYAFCCIDSGGGRGWMTSVLWITDLWITETCYAGVCSSKRRNEIIGIS